MPCKGLLKQLNRGRADNTSLQDNNLTAKMPGPSMVVTALATLQAQRRRRAQRRRMRAQERVYRPRRDLFAMPDYEVYGNFRFDREAILELTQILQEDLTTPTQRSHALPPLQKVMATLNFLATAPMWHYSPPMKLSTCSGTEKAGIRSTSKLL